MWRDTWKAKEDALKVHFVRSSEHLDSHAHNLPKLNPNDRVFVQNQSGPHLNKWDRLGVVVEIKPFDQHVIKLDGSGRLTLRNRRFLRKFTLPSTHTYGQWQWQTSHLL